MSQSPFKPKLLVLVGPTAIGKTKLSLEIARIFGCEIISGDSMQIYRGMNIGTAKILPEEQQGIPHHLIDIFEPDEAFSAALFQKLAGQLILEIHANHRLPFIVGGTGLYIESLCYDFQFSEASSDEAFREEQTQYLQRFGEAALHQKLEQVDPESAARLHPNNTRRVIRALEILQITGKTLSDQLSGQKKQSPFDLCMIGLTMDRALLYKRIEQRIDQMIEQGLVEEVNDLLKKGYTRELISMQGLGYKEIIRYLQGEYGLDEAVTLLKRDTRHYAKRQMSWFRHMTDIHWVDVTDFTNFSTHLQTINDIIAGKFK
ncbi:MAG: tRNA delta(2)-isopentenylpyrophosphate transferase [Bacilli bacterium]|nr:tRNA delta(2)-isopentenylpyrophosphate transferase [Bacilli bacterium]